MLPLDVTPRWRSFFQRTCSLQKIYPASKTRTTIAITTKIATGTKILNNAPIIGNQKGAVISKKTIAASSKMKALLLKSLPFYGLYSTITLVRCNDASSTADPSFNFTHTCRSPALPAITTPTIDFSTIRPSLNMEDEAWPLMPLLSGWTRKDT